MEVREIVERLDDIARANQKYLYVKKAVGKGSQSSGRFLDCVFFSPFTGKSQYLKVDLDKFDFNTLSEINMYLMDRLKVDITDYYTLPDRFPPVEDEVVKYCKEDVKRTLNMFYGTRNMKPSIEKVIFNDPATIVFWSNGTKTVVKTRGDDAFDPEKGLAMAISKKFLGNTRDYYEVFEKHIGRYEKQQRKKKIVEGVKPYSDAVKALQKLGDSLKAFNK